MVVSSEQAKIDFFLRMVNIKYYNIPVEFSKKLTEKFREFTHQPADKVNSLQLVVSLLSSIMTWASGILR